MGLGSSAVSCSLGLGISHPAVCCCSRVKGYRYSGIKWKPRALAQAALVKADPPAVVLKDGNGSASSSNNNNYAIQVAGEGGESYLPLSNGSIKRDRTNDLQAEVRAMARAANASVYSPQLLAIKYGSRPFKLLQRTLEIVTGLGSFAVKLLLDQWNGELDQNKRLRAVELRRVFTRLGPTFIKFGQGLSTRPDICPPEYLEELSELQFRCKLEGSALDQAT
ncbi:hypothetical protein Ancab_002462 [Ancistrocladus abbreviatus]